MTDLNPSQEILRLCKELGVEPPKHSVFQNPFTFAERIEMTASDLLKWDGWGDQIMPTIRRWEYEKEVTFDADYMSGDDLIGSKEHNDPDTALQHLALARLRQIKQEKEDGK